VFAHARERGLPTLLVTHDPADAAAITFLVTSALDRLEIAHVVVGSLASSLHGMPRSTNGADVLAALRLDHVEPLVGALDGAFYVDADMIRDAIRRRSSCNLIHDETIVKVDLFIRRDRPFEQTAFERVTRKALTAGAREYDFTTAEDIVLHKLEWYRDGNRVSERQWRDVIGVMNECKNRGMEKIQFAAPMPTAAAGPLEEPPVARDGS
jgi:hypothetical protein